jgi:hypothetical protein
MQVHIHTYLPGYTEHTPKTTGSLNISPFLPYNGSAESTEGDYNQKDYQNS